MTLKVWGHALTLERTMAKELCRWLGLETDHVLFQTVVAVNLALQRGHSCLLLSDWAGLQLSEDGAYHLSLPPLAAWRRDLAALPLKPEDDFPLVFEADRIYLRRYWTFETELAAQLKHRLEPDNSPLDPEVLARMALLFPARTEAQGGGTDWQRVAAINTLHQRLSVIAGGPGTGKTYTVTRILGCLLAQYEHRPVIRLVAPTGKAAQRLTESIAQAKSALYEQHGADWILSIPDQASTIHRLLGVRPKQLQFRHNSRNPLRLDCLLIDEASMVDLPLMTRLFRALPNDCRIILIGDAEQLPSVAAGSVLADLTPLPHPGYSVARAKSLGVEPSNKSVPADYLTFLRHSHRFDDQGGIGVLAGQVMRGEISASWETLLSDNAALKQVPQSHFEQQLRQWVDEHYRPLIQAQDVATAWQFLAAFRVLCATRVGKQGTVALNTTITQWLMPGAQTYFRGQPIMVTQNDYGLDLFNGDVGLIWPDDDGQLVAFFPRADSQFLKVSVARLPLFETVFAMTIHKTQGSEFEQVVMVLPDKSSDFLSRELIYTGLTRAKKHFSYCGDAAVWRSAVARHAGRHSGLRMRLGLSDGSETAETNVADGSKQKATPPAGVPEQTQLDF